MTTNEQTESTAKLEENNNKMMMMDEDVHDGRLLVVKEDLDKKDDMEHDNNMDVLMAPDPVEEEPQEASPMAQAKDDVRPQWSPQKTGLVVFAVLAVIVAIILAVTLSGEEKDVEEPFAVPSTVDFQTGVSLITSYSVNATISQRLARTVVKMRVANAMDCTSIHGITLQIPLAARVASLRTVADDGCTTVGQVMELEDARETFVETAAQGLPGAYVESQDTFTYSVQVSLPPLGITNVELVLEEVLRQRVGEIVFEVPLVPNEKVDQVTLDIDILDSSVIGTEGPTMVMVNGTFQQARNANITGPSFEVNLGSGIQVDSPVSPFSLHIPDAREYDLPRIMLGKYVPAALPDQGVLLRDGNCFEHIFLPSTLQAKHKNVFFVVDSSHGDKRFSDATKKALGTAIDSLSAEDILTIQSFSEIGTMELWGSSKATENEKADAKLFVKNKLVMRHNWGSNLHEALLEGLLRARSYADKDDGAVTLLVLLSNSWAHQGETNRTKIASDVWKLNQDGKVKIFSLGGNNADLNLLRAIAIMNGGVTNPVSPGTTTLASQMESFFESEFGRVLLSDVNVEYSGEAQVYGETARTFPLLAEGTEVVVRGLLQLEQPIQSDFTLQAITSAVSSQGPQNWTTTALIDPFVPSLGLPNSRCFQSYAHARITQLVHLRDVAELLGDGVVEPIFTPTLPCDRKEKTLADCIKEEALQLALQAKVVARGLTGMVTVDNNKCLNYEKEAEICLDGTSRGEYWDEAAVEGGNGYDMAYEESNSHPMNIAWAFFITIFMLLLGIYL